MVVRGRRTDWLIWGDSHAMVIIPAVDAYLKSIGESGKQVTHFATAPVLGFYNKRIGGLNENAIEYNSAVLAYVKRHRVRNVLIVGWWGVLPGFK